MVSSFHNWDYPAGFRVSYGGAGAVGAKADDYLAVSDSAKPAGLTGNIISHLGRTHDDCPPSGGVSLGRGVHWDNGAHWASVSFGQGVSFPSVISRQVHGEPPGVRMSDPVQGVSGFFVGVGEALPPDIGADNLAQGGGVQVFTRSGQIARYIVTPQGPSGQGGD